MKSRLSVLVWSFMKEQMSENKMDSVSQKKQHIKCWLINDFRCNFEKQKHPRVFFCKRKMNVIGLIFGERTNASQKKQHSDKIFTNKRLQIRFWKTETSLCDFYAKGTRMWFCNFEKTLPICFEQKKRHKCIGPCNFEDNQLKVWWWLDKVSASDPVIRECYLMMTSLEEGRQETTSYQRLTSKTDIKIWFLKIL